MTDKKTMAVNEASAEYSLSSMGLCPRGYKQTEIGVIPEDWDVATLRSCLKSNPKYGINAPAVTLDSGLPAYIRITDISEDGRFMPNPMVGVRHKESSNYYLKRGDLVFARTGASVGKCYKYHEKDGELVYAGFLIKISPDESKLISDYIFQYVNTKRYWQWITLMSMRSGQPGVNGNEYGQLPLPLPSTFEQKSIAKALSDVDELIVSLEKLIAKKRDIKTATMQQLLTGKKRLPGFGQGKGYKQTELGEIPEDWDVNQIEEIAKVTRGASPRPIDSPIWFDRNSNIGWLRISDVTKTNKYLFETTQNLSEKGIANSRFVSVNNLVMSICATVGRPIITRKDVCIHDGFVVFSDLVVNMEYLYYILSDIESDWSKHGQTGSQMNLNTGLINNTKVVLPASMEEQSAIARVLSDIDVDLNALDARLNKTKSIKQGMMQQLLTGRVRLVSP